MCTQNAKQFNPPPKHMKNTLALIVTVIVTALVCLFLTGQLHIGNGIVAVTPASTATKGGAEIHTETYHVEVVRPAAKPVGHIHWDSPSCVEGQEKWKITVNKSPVKEFNELGEVNTFLGTNYGLKLVKD